LLVLAVFPGCKKDDDGGVLLGASDLSSLRIDPDPADGTRVRIVALAGVVPAETEITVRNLSLGTTATGTAIEIGSFDITLGGSQTDVLVLQAEDDPDPLIVARTATGSVVRATGEGWATEVGCALDGWSGIIRSNGGTPNRLDDCAILAQVADDEAFVSGALEPFVPRTSTVARLRAVVSVVHDIELVLGEEDGTEHVVVLTPNIAGDWVAIEATLDAETTDAAGEIITTERIRSHAETALAVSDLALIGVDPPPEL
jgi:hypothetical protein